MKQKPLRLWIRNQIYLIQLMEFQIKIGIQMWATSLWIISIRSGIRMSRKRMCFKNDDDIHKRVLILYSKVIKSIQNVLHKNVYREYNLRLLSLPNITEIETIQIYYPVEKIRIIYDFNVERSFSVEWVIFKSYLLSL